jgi:hypothetical protein
MRDEIANKKSTSNECLVLNTADSSSNGTHWTCLYIQNATSYYFDSYGFSPPLEILDYCTGDDRCFNSFKIQQNDEVICGHYCVYMLYCLNSGYKFYDVLNELYRCEM